MADVSRAQLVVVSPLLLAAVLDWLALVLNTGIFAGNQGSRETSSELTNSNEQPVRLTVTDSCGRMTAADNYCEKGRTFCEVADA